MYKYNKVLFIFIFIIYNANANANANATDKVTLAWDANVDSVSGYKLYYGSTSKTYIKNIDVGNVTTYTIENLDPGTYYFVATTYIENVESGFSNEVSTTLLPDSPRIILISVTDISTISATITWVTDVDCSGTAFYSLDSTSWFAVISNNLGTTDHLSKFTTLKTRTHYFFKVQSVCNGNVILNSEVRSFNTK
jgi:hypothetical protein